MPQGKVKFYNPDKGYGFVESDDGGPDVFVHRTALVDAGLQTLDEGTLINYDLETDRKNGKTKASNISLA